MVQGKVYDVTPFLDDHPGGEDIILQASGTTLSLYTHTHTPYILFSSNRIKPNLGKDATEDFVGHSSLAWSMLEQYLIGFVTQ